MFNKKLINKAKFVLDNKHSKFEEFQDFEIKDLAVVWSYYSGKFEGNMYTYAETECLLKDGITPANMWASAHILKVLYNTFMFVVETINEKVEFGINHFNIKALHSELTCELI